MFHQSWIIHSNNSFKNKLSDCPNEGIVKSFSQKTLDALNGRMHPSEHFGIN